MLNRTLFTSFARSKSITHISSTSLFVFGFPASHPTYRRSVRRIIVLIACGLFVPRLYADQPVDYVTQIKPILVARCYACHSALRKKSGLRLDTAAAFVAGGESGPAIEPGNADGSYLIEMLTGESG